MFAVIWTKDGCKFCDYAKILLEHMKADIQERNISSSDWSKEDLKKVLPDVKTVPQIFIDGKHIGGYHDLNNLFGKMTAQHIAEELNRVR